MQLFDLPQDPQLGRQRQAGGLPPAQGQGRVADYQFNTSSVHWLFCKRCGVRSFSHGDIPEVGGKYYAVQLASLDVDDEALAAAPVRYCNGRDNDWWHEPSEAEKKFL